MQKSEATMTSTKQGGESRRREESYVRWLQDLSNDDVEQVGGKNASLGEMLRSLKKEGVRVPNGFATTARAYREFLTHNDLEEEIRSRLEGLAPDE